MRKKVITWLWISVYIIIILLILLLNFIEDPILVINYNNTKSTIVYDVNNQEVLYAENIHKKMLPASLTKVLTLLTAYHNINLEEFVLIDQEIINSVGSRIYLELNDYIQIKDLLYGLILQSGNDAALAISKAYSNNPEDFVLKMNEEVSKLGLKNSYFSNPSGLDEDNYNYTTTYDFVKITEATIKIPLLKEILGTSKYTIKLDNKNLYLNHKHKLINRIDGFIGGKTGYTKKAGRTLVSILEKENKLLIVVTFNDSNDWQTHMSLAKKFL